MYIYIYMYVCMYVFEDLVILDIVWLNVDFYQNIPMLFDMLLTIFSVIIKMQNTCNLIGWSSVHISDIFDCYSANINGMWSTKK